MTKRNRFTFLDKQFILHKSDIGIKMKFYILKIYILDLRIINLVYILSKRIIFDNNSHKSF